MLNNTIHDKTALIAINILEEKHKGFKFYYSNAGVGGIDLTGKRNDKIKLVAEIKTTTIERKNTIMGPQMKSIKKDLDRLVNEVVDFKYLVLISEKVEKSLKKRLDFENKYSTIKILTVISGL